MELLIEATAALIRHKITTFLIIFGDQRAASFFDLEWTVA
jgi:hypothetical protein